MNLEMHVWVDVGDVTPRRGQDPYTGSSIVAEEADELLRLDAVSICRLKRGGLFR